jgi:thioredoxin reductase
MYLRPTIIFDVGKNRKSNLHGYLGFEKSPREEVIQKAWKDVLQYKSIKVVNEKVTAIEKDYNNNLFLIKTKGDKNNKKKERKAIVEQESIHSGNVKTKAKYVIIATGIEYTKPNIKNLRI